MFLVKFLATIGRWLKEDLVSCCHLNWTWYKGKDLNKLCVPLGFVGGTLVSFGL